MFLSTPTAFESEIEFEIDASDARATVSLDAYDTAWFCLQYGMKAPTDPEECAEPLDRTLTYWRDWTHECDESGEESDCHFGGYAHDLVVRSELVFKLLAYRDTGAIAARCLPRWLPPRAR